MHPTAEGVDVIVKNILPTVEAFLGAIAGNAVEKQAAITLTPLNQAWRLPTRTRILRRVT